MDLRVKLIEEYAAGESIAALSDMFEVSRKTIYKWLARYEAEGVAGLADQSRAPHQRPQQVGSEMVAQILAARQKWKWGPHKLLRKLREADAEQKWPATSTIAELLRRNGLSHKRRKRVRTPLCAEPIAAAGAVNDTWCADFKGWFRTRDGTRCDPLTITDQHSRYLLRCHIVAKTDTVHVEAIFDAAFREYGLPQRIHTDNGAPFASRAPGGLSRLSMRWIKLGIVPERSRPASPQDNGRHERMHLSLKQEALQEPAANPRRQQEALEEFQQRFNFERPHQALQYATPASLYVCSPRPMPRRVPEVEYEEGMLVRRVNKGELGWKSSKVFVSEVFDGETLGLRQSDDRYWEMFFGPVALGWLDTHRRCFRRTLPRQGPWK